MRNLSIKAHLWIAFAVIAIIPVALLSCFHILKSYESSAWSIFITIASTLLVTLLLAYFHAKRINTTIRILLEYIQEVICEEHEIKQVHFPRFAPREFHVMAEYFFLMAKKIKDGQQALLKLNAELEQRIEERTDSLLRTNRELAVLNRLITPVSPYPGGASIIGECLKQFFEISGVNVKLYLTKPVISLLGPCGADFNDDTDDKGAGGTKHKNAYRYYIQAIRSGNTTFGHFVVPNSPLSEADQQFLQTLSHSAGRVFQNEILSRTIQQNHAVLNAVLESMHDAIILIDNKKQEVVYANGRMADILDIPRDRIRGLREEGIFAAIAARPSDFNQEAMQTAMRECSEYQIKIQKGKSIQHIQLSAFPVISDEKYTIGKGVFWRDVTKEYEVEKLKSDLISMVSHEFKTPITSIKGSVETLLRADAYWEEDFKKELLAGIHEDIGCIQELVNDWLDISRIDAGAIGLDREAVRPHVIVDTAVRKLPKHFMNGVNIAVAVNEKLPLIYGDRVRLGQVLSNLFTNAIRYNDRKPHIEISARDHAGYIEFCVADNGIGISERHIDKVFDRFYCVDTGRGRRTGSTGLGLAICKGIVEAHGGTISVQSSEGIGSIFTVAIPQYKCVGDNYEEM